MKAKYNILFVVTTVILVALLSLSSAITSKANSDNRFILCSNGNLATSNYSPPTTTTASIQIARADAHFANGHGCDASLHSRHSEEFVSAMQLDMQQEHVDM
jgi:hypothetical protein